MSEPEMAEGLLLRIALFISNRDVLVQVSILKRAGRLVGWDKQALMDTARYPLHHQTLPAKVCNHAVLLIHPRDGGLGVSLGGRKIVIFFGLTTRVPSHPGESSDLNDFRISPPFGFDLFDLPFQLVTHHTVSARLVLQSYHPELKVQDERFRLAL